MVDRNIEETLNLIGMEVHRDETVDAGYAEKISHEFGCDRNARFVLAVLTGPAEIRNDSDD